MQKNVLKREKKDKEKAHANDDSYKQWTKRSPHKCFRCGSVDHLIDKCLKPPKDNKKR